MTEPHESSTHDPASAVLGGYRPMADSYDEAVDASGQWRPAWQPFITKLEEMGAADLGAKWQQAQRLIRENGVTYNAFGDPSGMDRPWELDPIPFIIGSDEWRELQRGLIQRAKLLEMILADIYGPQQLLHEGILPPALVFGQTQFLRSCHKLNPPGGRHLPLYSADLGRGPDGKWCVLADRTEAMIGAGYALENRLAVSRALPNKFRDCGVARLAEYFAKLREMLVRLSPRKENPRIVLLSSGPLDPTYFEHVYLARYLGFTLVEGADLTVRDAHVSLKTLRGLYPVDVILRRVASDLCDPLEFDGSSTQGVAGLMRAVRAGQVMLGNPLGTAIVESPGFKAFMPQACRRLLGEELMLPSIPTWWCGDERQRVHVAERMSELAIHSADNGSAEWSSPDLGGEEREKLRSRMLQEPHRFVAQERMRLSTAPAWNGQNVAHRHIMFRAYLSATEEDSFEAMPGGLTLARSASDPAVALTQRGEGSKDTWVLSDGPVSSFSLMRPPTAPVSIIRGGYYLPSRVADNLFWLGRYAERAEGQTRLLRILLGYLADDSVDVYAEEIATVMRGLASVFLLDKAATARINVPSPEIPLREVIFDVRQPSSLRYTVTEIERVAWRIRDRFAPDAWRAISNLDVALDRGGQEALSPADIIDVLQGVLTPLEAFSGLALESMVRGHGWHFLDMGRRLERSLYTVRLLQAAWVKCPTEEAPALESVMTVCNSMMTYRSRYMSNLQAGPAMDMLLIDETNPRSVAFQFAQMLEHERRIADPGRVSRSEEGKIILGVLTDLRLADAYDLAFVEPDGDRQSLNALLLRLAADLPALSDAISLSYFSHAQPTRAQAILSPPPEGL